MTGTAQQAEMDARVRNGLRASRLVWWMGMLAAAGSLTVLPQIASDTPWAVESLPQVLWLEESSDPAARMSGLPLWVQVLAWLPSLVMTAALAASAFLLSPILHSVAAGRSFGEAVEHRLHRISLVLAVGSVLALVLELAAIWQIGVAISAFEAGVRADGVDYSVAYGTRVTIYWLPLALGIVAAAFRWVIRDGAALEKEVEGVI